MYSDSSDGEGNESFVQKKILHASYLLRVRNLRKSIGSTAGTCYEALMMLETKQILLEIFKEKQQESAEGGTRPSFYKKVPLGTRSKDSLNIAF